ncbi:MAG TPA: DUF2071 domain-containing protein [Solirubrobacteraceae bacterium]|jgi:uncharacterized protein YqjF (DUF2071 family)|nr:DUF2071 domain-containing protein [Solirubrobacteraceae bacterium]
MAAAATRPFLTAEWHHVLALTYAVDAALLAHHLPRGAEIDELEGSPRVSVVAFGFRHTRLRGIAIPGHIAFPEINLRFYVRLGGERAVVFIREFVPRPAISIVARLRYNEPYRTIPMRETVIAPGRGPGGRLGVRHRFGPRHRHRLEAWADPVAREPARGSSEYWLTHHDIGLGRAHDGRTQRYRVEHPVWALHEVLDLQRDVDFGALYGKPWRFLGETRPSHVTLAAGSGVRIFAPVDA